MSIEHPLLCGCAPATYSLLLRPSISPTADPFRPPVKSFPSSNRMSLKSWFVSFYYSFSPHCHCYNCIACSLTFWKALFRKCLLNNRKLISGSIVYSPKCSRLSIYFPKLCVEIELHSVLLSVKSPNLSGMNGCSWPNWSYVLLCRANKYDSFAPAFCVPLREAKKKTLNSASVFERHYHESIRSITIERPICFLNLTFILIPGNDFCYCKTKTELWIL